jgi:uncharacterized protein
VGRPVDLTGASEVSVPTPDGLTLRGWYVPPRTGAVVVFAHGFGGNRTQLLPEARAVLQSGHGVLLYDARAHGESEGSRSTMGDRERRDIQGALAFVRAQAGVTRVGAVGFSIGADALADVAARDPAIAAVILVSPNETIEAGIRSAFRGVLKEWAALQPLRRAGVDVGGVRPIDAIPRILPRPLLVVAGTLEPDIPMGERLARATGSPDRFLWVEGAHHGDYADVAPGLYLGRVRDFFDAAFRTSR